LTACFDWVLAE